jgi:transcriptional regulator with GAF, ATPase, and Fis domain
MSDNLNSTVFQNVVVDAFFLKPDPCLKLFIEELERRLIVSVLERVYGNQKEAARILGIKYTTLNEKVKRYGINFRKLPVSGDIAGMALAM